MTATKKIRWSILSFILVCLLGCSSDQELESSGPIARIGTTPTIDGIFEDGEWDDAMLVQVSQKETFRIKHDKINLYFAFAHDGGNLFFNKDTCVQILHASAQLGSAEYVETGSLTLLLNRAFDWQLDDLQNESAKDINKTVADYLAENGWVASIGPLGNFAQAEWAVSFDWMGITEASKPFAATPGLFIFSARMRLSPEEKEEFMALPPEERKNRYPALNWPEPPVPNDSLNRGLCPETINIDSSGWGTIWIDLQSRITAKQE